MRPGISFSARMISLRPQAASELHQSEHLYRVSESVPREMLDAENPVHERGVERCARRERTCRHYMRKWVSATL